MDLEQALAEHASSVPFERIGSGACEAARRATLDTLGCMIAAPAAPGIDVMVDLARQWGGRAEATVIGCGLAAPAPLAAWINGAMARALEIDDCTDFLPLHPSAALVPALLALAEARPALCGREFLVALAVGQDMIVRLGRATRLDGIASGRYNLFKIFGIVAAGARALRLDAARTRHAMGIAYAMACGEGQSAVDGALAFRTHEGNAAQAAITALLMAERGFSGAANFLSGSMGFFTSFEPQPRLEHLTVDLGRRFHGDELSFKPYAACRCTHTAIGLVLDHRTRVSQATPQAIRVRVAPGVHKLVGAAVGAGLMAQAAAQFSIPYTVAAAWHRGDFFLEQVTPAALADHEVLSLAQRVTVTPDEAMCDDRFVTGRTSIDICFVDGPDAHLEGVEPPGNPANPVSWAQVQQKFRKCVASAPQRPAEETVQGLIDSVATLESLPDIRLLLQGLRG